METGNKLIYIKTETGIIPLRADRILAVYVQPQTISSNPQRRKYKVQYLYKEPGRARQAYMERDVSKQRRNKLEKHLQKTEFEYEIIEFYFGTLYIRWKSIPRLTRSREIVYNFVRRVFDCGF